MTRYAAAAAGSRADPAPGDVFANRPTKTSSKDHPTTQRGWPHVDTARRIVDILDGRYGDGTIIVYRDSDRSALEQAKRLGLISAEGRITRKGLAFSAVAHDYLHGIRRVPVGSRPEWMRHCIDTLSVLLHAGTGQHRRARTCGAHPLGAD